MRALRVGLTGGIGAGKSLACSRLSKLGARIVDADEIAREQAKPGGIAYRRIVKTFGTADRAVLAQRVFSNPTLRRKLERLTHPLVLKELKRQIKAAKPPVVVVAVPLLFEAGLAKMFDVTVTIEAAKAERLRRAKRRDAASVAHISARMNAQMSDVSRRARADVVISNDGPKSRFLNDVRSYYRAFELLQTGMAAARL